MSLGILAGLMVSLRCRKCTCCTAAEKPRREKLWLANYERVSDSVGMTEGRAKDRTRKTLSLPADLTAAIQAEADEKFGGDFTRAVLERLAMQYPEAREFLRKNTTWKHSRKKV